MDKAVRNFGQGRFEDYPSRVAKSWRGHFVYLLWHQGEVVYVGYTSRLRRRIQDHSLKAKSEAGWFDFNEVTVKKLSSKAAALAEEARQIRLWHPPHNTIGRDPKSFKAVDLLAALGLRKADPEFVRRA